MKPEQKYADLLPESSDNVLNKLVQELDTAYTAPQRPAGLSWATVSQRLTLVSQQTPSAERRPQLWPSLRLYARRRKSWTLATAAALVIALLAAGFGGPLSHWFGGRTSIPFAYAAINQSLQISNGIKLTATKGYVDPKHLVLYYDVQLSSDLSGKYGGGAFVEKSTIQGKDARGVCERSGSVKGINPVYHCAIIFPSGGDIAGDTLKVTWHISEMRFMPREPHPTPGEPTTIVAPPPTPTFVQGDWTLRFSIPFRHEVQDPLQISLPGVIPFPSSEGLVSDQ